MTTFSVEVGFGAQWLMPESAHQGFLYADSLFGETIWTFANSEFAIFAYPTLFPAGQAKITDISLFYTRDGDQYIIDDVGFFDNDEVIVAIYDLNLVLDSIDIREVYAFEFNTLDDDFYGAELPDRLYGGPGHDTLYGYHGDDTLGGDAGNDSLFGEAGHDILTGGRQRDTLVGGAGHDALSGDGGHDSLFGNAGRDLLAGGRGSDTLTGAAGKDELFGGAGHDLLLGGKGRDALEGGNGHDGLFGEGGADFLDGERGHDVLMGGGGNDTLAGGGGRDTFVFANHRGRDVILDFDPRRDLVDLADVRGIDGLGDLSMRAVANGTTVILPKASILFVGEAPADVLDATFIF